jgi:hypothetical protein
MTDQLDPDSLEEVRRGERVPQGSGPPFPPVLLPPVGPYYDHGPEQPQNVLSVLALISSMVGVATFVFAPVGATLGHVALR